MTDDMEMDLDTITTSDNEEIQEEVSSKKEKKVRQQASPVKPVGDAYQNYFLQPFMHRMRFLYCGLSHEQDVFVLGTEKESDIYLNDPTYAIGIVRVKDQSKLLLLKDLFASLSISLDQYAVVDLAGISQILSKVKWDVSRVTVDRHLDGSIILRTFDPVLAEKTVSVPIFSYYTFEKAKAAAAEYYSMITATPKPYLDVPTIESDVEGNLLRVVVDEEVITASPLAAFFKGRIKATLQKGLDLVDLNPLKKREEKSSVSRIFWGLRLWTMPSPGALAYLHIYDHPEFTAGCARSNVFMFSSKGK